MRKIPTKNYIILIILLVVTILLTFYLSSLYSSQKKLTSEFYEYANKISINEFDEYMLENSEAIIYISDKYDLDNEEFEKKFESKIDILNLKDKIVFIDKNEIDKEFLNKLKKNYAINIDISKTPIVIVIADNSNIKNVYVNQDTNVNTFIDYEVFK